MSDNIIFDSSIWIDIARRIKRTISFASSFIEENNVLVVDLICAEVLRGAHSEKDYNNLNKILHDFEMLRTDWSEVARLAYLVSRKGFNPPLADLYIANCAIENDVGILTRDKHFLAISSVRKFKVITL
jgi:predicted nucleic acid-binding protein